MWLLPICPIYPFGLTSGGDDTGESAIDNPSESIKDHQGRAYSPNQGVQTKALLV